MLTRKNPRDKVVRKPNEAVMQEDSGVPTKEQYNKPKEREEDTQVHIEKEVGRKRKLLESPSPSEKGRQEPVRNKKQNIQSNQFQVRAKLRNKGKGN